MTRITTLDNLENKNPVIGFGPKVVPEELRHYIQVLIDRIHYASSIPGAEGMIQLHNAFTAYVLEMLFFTTGHRPITRAFANIHNFDLGRKLLLISDKDRADAKNTRVVPLVDVVVIQIKKYQAHAGHLSRLQPNWAHAPSRKSGMRVRPFLFTVDQKKPSQWRSSTAKDLKRFRHGHLQAEPNLQRSYLSTRLNELTCPGVYIEAFLGHWHSGLNPFSIYSALPPLTLAGILKPYLEDIAAQDGWRPLDAF
jgi:hypothetical protein